MNIEHTQDIYQKAIKFAGEKHCHQKLPGSEANYLVHISNVAMEVLFAHKHEADFNLELALAMAILHDTIEDTSATYEEISELFGGEVAKGILALTKNSQISDKKERMKDSLRRINLLKKEVGIVKLADRITNLQRPPKHWSEEKIQKYCLEAKTILNELSGKNKYLEDRLKNKIENYQRYF